MNIEHSEASRIWDKVHQPGHPVQTAARLAVLICLRRRHPAVIERHIDRVQIAIARLEKQAQDE